MKSQSSNWFTHPSYFAFWLFVGAYAWTYSFQQPPESEKPIHLSSQASPEREVANDDDEVTFTSKLREIEEEYKNFEAPDHYVMTPSEVDEFEKMSEGLVDIEPEQKEDFLKRKRFSFQNISEDDLNFLVSYEDPKTCGDQRNYLEKSFAHPKLAEWTQERAKEPKNLSRKCVAFVLNSFPEVTTKETSKFFKNRGATAFGKCSKPDGAPQFDSKGSRIKNPTPCVSKSLVNATYNAYADVTACLNLDPKLLLPKIYNESGFYVNALGSGRDAGVGQLTKSAIDQVNTIYPQFMEQMTKAAQLNPTGACARIMKHKALIAPVKSDVAHRCSLMWPIENPLKNIVYSAILTRYNIRYVSGISFQAGKDIIVTDEKEVEATGTSADEFGGKMKELNIRQKLEQLGLKNANLHAFKEMIVLIGYNSGVGTAMNALESYLDQRIAENTRTKSKKYNLTMEHFNFESTLEQVKEARAYIMSSFISPKLDKAAKNEKIKMRKALPTVWKNAYQRSFPEYLALRLNDYKGGSAADYDLYGFPGYLTTLARKNKMIRDTFQSGGVDPNFCTLPNFLKFK